MKGLTPTFLCAQPLTPTQTSHSQSDCLTRDVERDVEHDVESDVERDVECSDFWFFFRNKVYMEKICRILENLRKTFSIGKKSDFKFQNREYFVKKNDS